MNYNLFINNQMFTLFLTLFIQCDKEHKISNKFNNNKIYSNVLWYIKISQHTFTIKSNNISP